MENYIFNSFFTEFFVPPFVTKLIISNMLTKIYACIYGYMIQHDLGLESCKYLILNAKVNSTEKKIQCNDARNEGTEITSGGVTL